MQLTMTHISQETGGPNATSRDDVKCNCGEAGYSQGAVVAGLHRECRAAGRGSEPRPHTRVALVKMEYWGLNLLYHLKAPKMNKIYIVMVVKTQGIR